jgi:hypothetical protein
MTWTTILSIILQGLPQDIALVESLFQKWTSGTPPTQADFDALRAAATRSAKDRLILQLQAAGIPLTDPLAVKLLAMT